MSASSQPAKRRFWLLVVGLVLLIIVPFLIWGEWFERMFDPVGAKSWLESFGPWAWAGALALLIGDLFLPVPGTVVMSALGLVYGWFWGGLISILGATGSGLLAYGLCRAFGHRVALWLAGEEGLKRGEKIFQGQKGGWLVAMSRWLPVLPEAVACLAGLTRMRLRTFITAILAGNIPLGFVFAAIGDLGLQHPGWALALSALAPVGLYAAATLWMRRQRP